MTESSNELLQPGKLPARLLGELFNHLPKDDARLLLGPAIGEDAAVIDFAAQSERVLVVKSDPITFATDEIGYYAVNICVNDLAVTGATPRYYLPTLLLPAGAATEEMAHRIYQQIGSACASLGIVVAGGHSEITPTVSQPIIAGTLLGDAPRNRFFTSGGGIPGNVLVMAGIVPVEGTSIMAREMREELLASGWAQVEIDEAAGYLFRPGISVLQPAMIAAKSDYVTAMHDPTEGGIATGVVEMALAAGTGVELDLNAIPIPELSARLCERFGLDPLGVIASGALLATVHKDHAEDLLSRWREIGWCATVIGRLTERLELRAHRDCDYIDLPRFAADEITKLWQ